MLASWRWSGMCELLKELRQEEIKLLKPGSAATPSTQSCQASFCMAGILLHRNDCGATPRQNKSQFQILERCKVYCMNEYVYMHMRGVSLESKKQTALDSG